MSRLALPLLLMLAGSAAAQQSPDERQWQTISSRLDAVAEADNPVDALSRRRELIEQARLYQSLYPGGQRCTSACRLELQTLFEVGCLESGRFEALRERCLELQRGGPPDARAEAAYWLIQIDRPGLASQPVDPTHDAQLLADFAGFCAEYPDSLRVPRLTAQLFDDAVRRGQFAELKPLVARLEEHHPRHLTTELLRGASQLYANLGQPFSVAGVDAQGRPVDSRLLRGKPLLVLFWNTDDSRQTVLVEQIEAARMAGECRVISVDLRIEAPVVKIPERWQQIYDRLGPAHRLARQWGIRHPPVILVVDATGRLSAVARPATWQAALRRATSQPAGNADSSPQDGVPGSPD